MPIDFECEMRLALRSPCRIARLKRLLSFQPLDRVEYDDLGAFAGIIDKRVGV